MTILAHFATAPILTEADLAPFAHKGDVLAYLADSPDHTLDDYSPTWFEELYSPSTESEAWWLGNRLGEAGLLEVLPPDHFTDGAKAAFLAGHWSGRDDYHAAMDEAARRSHEQDLWADEDRHHECERVEFAGCTSLRDDAAYAAAL